MNLIDFLLFFRFFVTVFIIRIVINVINIQIKHLQFVFFVELPKDSRMIFAGDILDDAVDLVFFFLHLLMMRSALIMSPGLDEIGHDLKDPTKPFIISGSKFIFEKLQEENIFKFFFFSPMTFFLIGYKVVNWSFLNKEWKFNVSFCIVGLLMFFF